MASIKKEFDANGQVIYKVQASGGRGRRVKRSWRPEPGWSARTIERELAKFAAQLENDLASGEVVTRQEDLEQQRQAELERAKLKTLRDYVSGVFLPAKATTMSKTGLAAYTIQLEKNILPTLGDFLLADITPAMLQKLLLNFQASGKAHASVIKVYGILNGVFKMAFLDDSIQQNPMLRVQRPKPRKDEPHKEEADKAFTVDQLRYILQCLENEPLKWRCYIGLLIDTGIRRGEACAVQWSDIDFKAGTITIRRNLQYTAASGVYETTPKNGKTRVVDCGQDLLDLLHQLREEQSHNALSKWVFTQDGTADPMHPTSPTHYFRQFGKRYDIADFHPHKLRHTSASIAITNGADVVSVSERLGHSDAAVTLRMYAHANDESIRRAGQIVRDALKAQGL